jgi:catechol 2,3-dioxygenase-like lactoylglutathione lyase family enzyme
MNEKQKGSSTGVNDTGSEKPPGIFSVHGVRYQVTDVARAAAFYTDHLGFRLEHQQRPAFASVSLGNFMLLLSGARSIGISSDARRRIPAAGRVESSGLSRGGSAGTDRRAEERWGEVSQSDGGWSRRPTDPGRRSRRESNRALRASSIDGSLMTQGHSPHWRRDPWSWGTHQLARIAAVSNGLSRD